MKLIKIIIIAIFVFSLFLSLLLFRSKNKRIEAQLSKKELGWNPTAIKKMVLFQANQDTVTLTKNSGVWKSNKKFDGMGIAPQLLVYLSTLQIENTEKTFNNSDFTDPILLQTYDKNGKEINTVLIGKDIFPGSCVARLNNDSSVKILHSNLNSKSLRSLLDSII